MLLSSIYPPKMASTKRTPLTAPEWHDSRYDDFRRCWEEAGDEPAISHRASGEKIAFRGAVSPEIIAALSRRSRSQAAARLPTNPWARFDYVFGSETYPLLIEIRQVRYPNPWPDRYVRAPYNGDREPTFNLTVWRLDHILSAALWKSERGNDGDSLEQLNEPPPYMLWRLAERAMIDAALLWPANLAVLPAADEVAVNGGWINGTWTHEVYRRHRPEDLVAFRSRTATRGVASLPLSEYTTVLPFRSSPKWESIVDASIGFHGERHEQMAPVLRNREDGTVIGSVGVNASHHWSGRVAGICTCRDDMYITLGMTSSEDVNRLEGWPGTSSAAVNASWNLMLHGYCAMGLRSENASQPSFIAKAVRSLDSIALRRMSLHYDGATVSHPLMSFDLYQWLYDCFLNALPFSRGFEPDTPRDSPRQGDVGRVYINAGYLGDMQILTTEIRLKLRLPSDDDETSWSVFFD